MIFDINSFDHNSIIMHDLYEINNNVSKIDLSLDKLKPLMLRLEDLQVLSFTHNTVILSLKGKENIKKIFDSLDSHIVNMIQEKKIVKKLKTKFNYRQLTSNYSNKDVVCDIVSLDVNLTSDKFSTELYHNKNKKLSVEEALMIMKDNSKVDLVLEIIGVLFNKDEGVIYLDNVVRQMKIKKIKPKRIENLTYSFVDSDTESESEINIKIETDDEYLVNPHTIQSESENESTNSEASN